MEYIVLMLTAEGGVAGWYIETALSVVDVRYSDKLPQMLSRCPADICSIVICDFVHYKFKQYWL